MTTGSRIRPHVDIGRLRDAIAGPGADPRNWCSFARVDDDPDAVRWDDVLGWLVDVTFVGGQLDGDGPCVCRVAWSYIADGEARSDPPQRNAQCIVVIPEGDPNVMPVIVGVLSDPTLTAPTSVNSSSVDEAYALATHFFSTAKNVSWDVRGSIIFASQDIKLATPTADQSFFRGQDGVSAIGAVLDAIELFGAAVQSVMTSGPFPKPGLETAVTQLQDAVARAKTDLQNALSTKIHGD